MTTKKAIKSISFLWLGSFIGSGSTFVIYAILGKELGPELFGEFSSAITTINIFSLLAGFGVAQTWLKLFGKESWFAIRWVKSSLRFVLLSLFIVVILLLFWVFLGPHTIKTKQLLFLLTFFLFGTVSVTLVSSKLQLEERFQFLSFWQLSPNLTRLLLIFLIFIVLNTEITLINIAYIYAFVGIIFTLISIISLLKFSNRKINSGTNKSPISKPKIKEVFKEVWPFGLASIFAFIYIQSDIIMIKYLSGDLNAGYYTASFTILTAILVFPNVLYSKFLMPKYHKWANYDKKKLYDYYKKGNRIMLFAGLLAMITVLLFSNFFMPFIFGKQYKNSVLLINILSLTLPVYFVAYSVGTTLVTNEHMKLKVRLMGYVALLNLILNSILIPYYQAEGAAFATVISNFILLLLFFKTAKEKVFEQI